MTPRLVRCEAVAPQPWRNGAGLTRELLAWPVAEAWQLRISVADIDADAPFSAFAGVDRCFAVIEGGGVALSLGGERQVVEADSAPLAFPGEAAPACTLVGGPTRDLNLMWRRGTGTGRMWRADADCLPAPAGTLLRALFVADAATLSIDGAVALRLEPFTLAWAAGAAPGDWRLSCDAHRSDRSHAPRAWWMHFDVAGAAARRAVPRADAEGRGPRALP